MTDCSCCMCHTNKHHAGPATLSHTVTGSKLGVTHRKTVIKVGMHIIHLHSLPRRVCVDFPPGLPLRHLPSKQLLPLPAAAALVSPAACPTKAASSSAGGWDCKATASSSESLLQPMATSMTSICVCTLTK